MKAQIRMGILLILVAGFLVTAPRGWAASVAVFPLQEFREGRNDANLPLTRMLVDALVAEGNEVISQRMIINFMAKHRIRALGHLETDYISRIRRDLGAAFVLLGTVSQQRERPEPSIGLTLSLIRTSDGREVWSYIDSLSRSDERRVLGVGEPGSVADLQKLLLTELGKQWPWAIINQVQPTETIQIDLARLEPRQVRPGDEVRATVKLRQTWSADQVPRVFFKADEQLYPATQDTDRQIWEGRWISGGSDGNYVVHLVLEWPDYGRTETALIGSYVVDGTPPVLSLDIQGVERIEDRLVFNDRITILPRMLLRKALSRWRLSFTDEAGTSIGVVEGAGALPESFIWRGRASYGRVEDGRYQVVMEVWDLAGNSDRADQWVELSRSQPQVGMAVMETDRAAHVNLAQEGKVPLEFWRMEMWTEDGRVLARSEGQKLPIQIDLELAGAQLDATTRGFVFAQDVLGNRSRRELTELLPNLGRQAQSETQSKPQELEQKWVDEF